MSTFDIVIVDVFPLDESTTPLRYQLIFIGGIPLIILQVIVRSYPSAMYAGDPIITVTSLLGITSGCGIHCPSAITGVPIPIKIKFVLRWLQIVHVWLLVRFSVFPVIYSCAGNTCGKLVKGCDKLVKGLFKGRGGVVKGHADRSLHLGKSF